MPVAHCSYVLCFHLDIKSARVGRLLPVIDTCRLQSTLKDEAQLGAARLSPRARRGGVSEDSGPAGRDLFLFYGERTLRTTERFLAPTNTVGRSERQVQTTRSDIGPRNDRETPGCMGKGRGTEAAARAMPGAAGLVTPASRWRSCPLRGL